MINSDEWQKISADSDVLMLLRTWTQGIILKVKSLKSYTEEYVRKQNSSSTEGQKLTPQHFAVYNFILQMRNAIFVPFIASYFS